MDAPQTLELSASDMQVVAGDQGAIELQGTSDAARAMCAALLASLRCGARLAGVRCVIEFADFESIVVSADSAPAPQ